METSLNENTTTKKVYNSPVLLEYGDLAEITHAGDPGSDDTLTPSSGDFG